jgi:hypothetical protein
LKSHNACNIATAIKKKAKLPRLTANVIQLARGLPYPNQKSKSKKKERGKEEKATKKGEKNGQD